MRDIRHNAVARVLADACDAMPGVLVDSNVHVPQWDRLVMRDGQQCVEEAWLDVKIADKDARERFFDTKVFCPFAPSYRGKALEKPAAHERGKHARYPTHCGGRRIMPVDLHAAVFNTSGGLGREGHLAIRGVLAGAPKWRGPARCIQCMAITVVRWCAQMTIAAFGGVHRTPVAES